MTSLLNSIEITTLYNDGKRSFKTSLYDSLETAFCALQAFVIDSYSLESKINKNDKILIQYKDEEGDLVTLGNVDDLKEALEFSKENENSLILFVTIQAFKQLNHQKNDEKEDITMINNENEETNENNNNNYEGITFGENFLFDLCNNECFKKEFISFLKTLLVLLKETAFDVTFDVETCVMQAISTHDMLMDYPIFKNYLFKFLKNPNLSNQIKFFSTFLTSIDPSQIETWVNEAINNYKNYKNYNENVNGSSNFWNNNNNNGFNPFGSIFSQNGNGATMPFFMQYLTNLVSNSGNAESFWNNNNNYNNNNNNNNNNNCKSNDESASKEEKPTKGGLNENDNDEPIISSTIGTKYENNNNNNNNNNGNNNCVNGSNEPLNDDWNMPPPPPPSQQPPNGMDFFSQLINTALSGAIPPNSNENTANVSNESNINEDNGQFNGYHDSPHGNEHHGHYGHHGHHEWGGRGFGKHGRRGKHGHRHGHGHGHRHGGKRGRGCGGRGKPFRPVGGAFGGPFAQLLTSIAGQNGVCSQGSFVPNVPYAPNSNNDNYDNNNNNNDNIDGMVLKDDSTLIDGACVFENQILFKTWKIRNVSNDSWTIGSIIKYIGEPFNPMINGASFSINNDKSIEPNDEIECQICIVAPSQIGEYESKWNLQLSNGKNVKLDKELFVKINVIEDNDDLIQINNNDINNTNVKELNGETSMNASAISVMNDNNMNINNNNNNGKGENDINSLGDLGNGLERAYSKEVDASNSFAKDINVNTNINDNDNVNDNDIEMKDEIEDLASSMIIEQNKNDEKRNNESFGYESELKSLKDMGFGKENDDLLKSLLLANEGNLDKVVGILSYS